MESTCMHIDCMESRRAYTFSDKNAAKKTAEQTAHHIQDSHGLYHRQTYQTQSGQNMSKQCVVMVSTAQARSVILK